MWRVCLSYPLPTPQPHTGRDSLSGKDRPLRPVKPQGLRSVKQETGRRVFLPISSERPPILRKPTHSVPAVNVSAPTVSSVPAEHRVTSGEDGKTFPFLLFRASQSPSHPRLLGPRQHSCSFFRLPSESSALFSRLTGERLLIFA